MNMLTFDLSIFEHLKRRIEVFFKENEADLEKCEFLIPTEIANSIEEDGKEVRVLETNATWYGVTYKEDTDSVKEALKKLTEENVYPNNLWD